MIRPLTRSLTSSLTESLTSSLVGGDGGVARPDDELLVDGTADALLADDGATILTQDGP